MRTKDMPAGHRHVDDLDERPLEQQALFAFMRATHAHRQLMSRHMTERGIHPSQSFALREIAHDEGITQRDLAERLHIARPTLTVMLQKMEKARLIERRADASDQRFTRIYLAEAGRQAHDAMHEVLEAVVHQTTGALTPAEQRDLIRVMGRLRESTDAALAGMGGPTETPEEL